MRYARHLFTIAVAALGAILAGCATYPGNPNIIKENYAATDALIKNLKFPVSRGETIVVASFVSVDDLTESSAFGRILAEQTATRLSALGYHVIELKLRRNIFIKEQGGEFLLSRDVRSLADSYNAQAVVVGTYAVADTVVYVTNRMVRPADNRILGAHDFTIKLRSDVKKLLDIPFKIVVFPGIRYTY